MNFRTVLRLSLLVLVVSLLVSLPFLLVGETFFLPLLEALKQRTFWLIALAVTLLALDAVLPVPSAWVIMLIAQQAGVATGILGGTLGLTAGVVVSAWVGRVAVGRLAPKFIPDTELLRLRRSILRHTLLTLACLRSVPVLAETSVMIAAAAGISQARLFLATVLPNLAICTVYSLAVEDSFRTACLAFALTIAVSYLFWRTYAAPASRTDRPTSG